MPTTIVIAQLLLLLSIYYFKQATAWVSGCDYGTVVNSNSEANSLNLFSSQSMTFAFNTGNYYACHENFYGTASNTAKSVTKGGQFCTTKFYFRCCPLKGYQNTDANCVGKVVSVNSYTPSTSKCPALASNNVACTPCSRPLPSNAQWTKYCGWICLNGFQVSGTYDSCICPATSYIDSGGTCTACPAVSNGVLSTARGNNVASCIYNCNYGYSWNSWGRTCSQCILIPTNAQIIAAGSCSYVCNAGYTLPVINWACTACPFNQYRAFSYTDQGCAQATPNALACSPGQYYVMSATDGSFSSCASCSAVAANVYYFTRNAQTQYSANIAARDQCYSSPCSVPSTAGMYTSGCGGASAGYTAQCTTINLATGKDCRYYLVQAKNTDPTCPTAACTLCPAGYFNSLCPAKTLAAANTAGNCQSVCTPVLNAKFVASTVGGADCPFQCNSGYFLSQGSCTPCRATSSSCSPGYYRPTACDPATGVDAACSGVCSYLQYQSASASLGTFGSGACQWRCSPGSYKALVSAPQTYSGVRIGVVTSSVTVPQCLACVPSSVTCGTGQYVLASCLTQYDATAPPSCDSCIIASNAVATGPSPAVNNATSCPITCNAGYWQKTTGSCALLTASGACTAAGMYWGGGTRTQDNACVACPASGQPSATSSNNVWPNPGKNCTWACTAGAYLDAQLNYCVQCPKGAYQPTNGLLAPSCTPCAAGYYWPGGVGAQACLQAPANSTVSADRSGFACNAGYTQVTSMYSQTTVCQPCLLVVGNNIAALNMSLLVFDAACAVTSFTCLPGFYRNLTASTKSYFYYSSSSSQATCTACPPLAPAGTTATTAWATQQQAAAVRACGAYPACKCPLDEKALACAPQQCSPGYFPNASKPCPTSSVSDSSMVFCQACPPLSCAAGTTLILCQNGQTASQCAQCSQAPSAQQGLLWISGCSWSCAYGYYYNSTSGCSPCPVGTYQSRTNYTASTCTACAAGSYLGTSGGSGCLSCTPGTYAAASKATTCTQCPAGYQTSANGATVCSACPSGTYASPTTCLSCPAATPYSLQASTACSIPPPPCPGGFYLSSSAVCVGCPAGFYCSSNAMLNCPWGTPPAPPLSSASTQCASQQTCTARSSNQVTACPPNTTNVNQGANSALWCHPKQGYYGLRGQPASLCPLDFYCPLVTTAPIPCPTGAYAVEGSASCVGYMLPPCRPGWYLPFLATQCSPCPVGSYCYGSQIFACNASSATMAWLTASTQSNSSAACIQAPSSPYQCPANTLPQYASSYLQCRAAPGYYFIPGTSAATICPAGYYCPAGGLQPVQCPAAAPKCALLGYAQVSDICPRGVAAPLDPCVQCTNQPSSGPFSFTAAGSCAFCCNAGYYYVAGGACVPQPTACSAAAFSYMPMYPACSTSSTQQCVPCPAAPANGVPMPSLANTYGVQACAYACNAGYSSSLSANCTSCPAGTYSSSTGATACAACPPSTYSPQAGSSSCLACSGAYGYPASAAAQRCSCVGGAYYNGSSCVACQDGAVPFNEYTCSVCPPGTVIGPTNNAIQAPCAAGGYRASPSRFTCAPCPPGTYSAASEATACTPCPMGTYAAASGQSACSQCLTTTAAAGSTACIPPLCPSPTSYFDAAKGLCVACASRCSANGAVVVPLTPGACTTSTTTTAADFTCVCPQGWYGDGFATAPCVRCANASQCICPSGSYYYFSAAEGGGCKPCRACPSTAVTLSPCLSGSTADTTVCVCPKLHYFSQGGLCVPCGVCPPGATAAAVCAAGSTADSTVCVCGSAGGSSLGNGVVCL